MGTGRQGVSVGRQGAGEGVPCVGSGRHHGRKAEGITKNCRQLSGELIWEGKNLGRHVEVGRQGKAHHTDHIRHGEEAEENEPPVNHRQGTG